jgi:hypothetical protein
MPRVSGSAWPWLLADDSDAIVGVRSGNIDQLFVFSNDDALNIDMSNLAATWNASGTTFTGIGLNVTDTASAAGSLLMDLQVGGTSQFKVSKGGRITAQTLTIGLGGQTAVAENTALGFEALHSASLTGQYNTGLGYKALTANTAGQQNNAVGVQALINNTTGNFNNAFGVDAVRSNTTGSSNTGIGQEALRLNTTGSSNSAVGENAIRSNTTGGSNSAVGVSALRNNDTGGGNCAFGVNALRNFNTSNNVAIGFESLIGNATVANNTGANNIAIGYQAGDAITSGSTNIAIGYQADVDSATASNQINIADRYFHDRIRLLERTSDPAKPTEGNCIVWMSDGTGLGDDGDVIISSTAGGVTNYAILFDHSAGTLWP